MSQLTGDTPMRQASWNVHLFKAKSTCARGPYGVPELKHRDGKLKGLSTKDLQPSTHNAGVTKMHVISTAVTSRNRLKDYRIDGFDEEKKATLAKIPALSA